MKHRALMPASPVAWPHPVFIQLIEGVSILFAGSAVPVLTSSQSLVCLILLCMMCGRAKLYNKKRHAEKIQMKKT